MGLSGEALFQNLSNSTPNETPENTEYGITELWNNRISEFQLSAFFPTFFKQKPILSLRYNWKVLHMFVKMLATQPVTYR